MKLKEGDSRISSEEQIYFMYFNIKGLLLVALLFVFQVVTPNNVLYIVDADEITEVGHSVELYEDKFCELSLSDIESGNFEGEFIGVNKDVFSKKPTKSCFWFRFKLANKSGKDLWIEPCDNRIWNIDFYKFNQESSWLKIESGSLRPKDPESIFGNKYCFQLSEGENTNEQTYYIRTKSKFPQKFEFKVGSQKALLDSFEFMNNVNLLFQGLILAIMMYSLFFFVSTKNILYLYYFLFLTTVFVVVPLNNGFVLFDYKWLVKNVTFVHVPVFLFQSLFLTKYLKLSSVAPIVNKIIIFITSIIVLVIPILTITDWVEYVSIITLLELAAAILYCFCLIACLKAIKQNQVRARFFTIGWVILIVGTITFLSAANGFIPLSKFTLTAMYWGVGFESILFGLALADHMNLLMIEKKIILEKNLDLVANQNELLEKQVTSRTNELNGKNLILERLYAEVQTKNKEVIDSINYAQRIQEAILSVDDDFEEQFGKDYFIFYQPKDIVSGDFYYLEEKENCVIVAAIDCTGHGVPGAFMTMIANNILNRIVHDMEIHNPGEILKLLSQELVNDFNNSDNQNVRDGMDISIMTIHKNENRYSKVLFAGSGQSLFYISENELKQIRGSKLPISIYQDNINYSLEEFEVHEIEITHDTNLFYLSTDGYSDQFGGPFGKKFMTRRFKELLFENKDLDMQGQFNIVQSKFKNWITGNDLEQIDDVTVLGFKLM